MSARAFLSLLSAFLLSMALPAEEYVVDGAFAGKKPAERASRDIPFVRDMRKASGVSFDLTVDDVGKFSGFTFYFHSGDGWYRRDFSPGASGRKTRVYVGKSGLSREGSPSGWRHVDKVRVSGWRGGTSNARMTVANLRVEGADAPAVVVQTEPGQAFPQRLADRLTELGVETAAVSADDVDADLLKGVQLVFVPGEPPAKSGLAKLLKAFARRGGKAVFGAERLPALQKDAPPGALKAFVVGKLPAFAGRIALAERREAVRRELESDSVLREPAGPAWEFRAFWCHNPWGLKGRTWDETAAFLKGSGFNAVVVNLAWGGSAAYPSDVLPLAWTARKDDPFAACRSACLRHGVAMHVWKVCFGLDWDVPKAFVERMRAEGRLQRTADGREVRWLCPSHPANRRLEVEAMAELAKKGPDGIHFDYIRFPGADSCFCATCRAAFERTLGEPVADWPRAVRGGGPLAVRWNVFRRGLITGIVRETSRIVRRESPHVRISAAVFGDVESARASIGQDWAEWIRSGYLDFVCPMDYTDSLGLFEGLIARQRRLDGACAVYPGIGLSSDGASARNAAARVAAQVGACRRYGFRGFCVFNLDAAAVEALALLSRGPCAPARWYESMPFMELL